MKTHTFFVENLKCNGCANTIRKEASKFSSVNNVTVDSEQSLISIEVDDTLDELEQIKQKLAKIGYPEIGAENNLATTAKSYVSCAVGRMGV
ncbi:MAG: heavy-metal-associated domain-containing protein [Bacteroidales bacterium]|jgi:copper chaperone|nr:heavy-metal-associated domain-containing protein [Bacteroidales bacterium]